jgi:plastocyanin
LRRRTALLIGSLVASLTLGVGVVLAADRSVTIADFAFSPGTVTITAGDRVTWTNEDAVEHTATGDGWDTGLLAQGGSGSIRFDRAGTYAYICTPHPSMTGTVVVQARASGGGGSTVTPPPGDTVPAPHAATGALLDPGIAAAILAGMFVLVLAVAAVILPRRSNAA